MHTIHTETNATVDGALNRWLDKSEELMHRTGQYQIRAGVSFKDLNCYGFISSDQYQSTFTTWIFKIPSLLRSLVSARSSQSQRVEILRDIQGLVHPGELLLVLGRPGSGCSTFLKTLAGDTYGFHVDDNGMKYGGNDCHTMEREQRGNRIYVAELDVHFPELTLGQTLSFAASTRPTGAGYKHCKTAASSDGPSRDVSSLFHLDRAFDTIVGNAMIRGISGGEKRRTSLAEAFIGGAQFQCWDNSTRGLDSSTALRFIRILRESANRLRSVVMMSIYQVSEAQYKHFDKVMLLYEGRQIYFGSTENASDYFQQLGFVRLSHSTTADFLTSLTNSAERVIQPGYEDRVPRTPDDFALVWRQSKQAKAVLEEICNLEIATAHSKESKNDRTPVQATNIMIPVHLQVLDCVRRGFQRLQNNYVPGVAGIIANSILALILSSAFYNMSHTADSMDKRAVLLFFALIINACTPAFEVLTMWAQRPIVEKHDRYAFYSPVTEAVTSMLCDVPNKLGTSILFNVTLYFMTNLRRTVSAFFVYYLFNLFVLLTMSMYFRMVGSVSRKMEQTMAPSSIAILLFSIYAGFVIPVPYMVPWLGWIRFINPMAYVYEGLMINEFRDREFPCSITIPAGPSYSLTTGMEGKVCPVIGSVPGQSSVQGSAYLAEKYSYVSGHIWRNLPITFALMVVFCAVHLLAAQYIPAQRSKGDVLVYRHRPATGEKGHGSKADKESNPNAAVRFAQDINKIQDHKAFKTSENGLGSPTIQSVAEQSAVFHWKNLCYDVKSEGGVKRILNNVNGWVKPGTMTALMGVSGAGKTTLLDVLANRASSGTASGEVLIGHSPRDSSFQRRVGYVQQEDVHPPLATVRETLQLSALLRQSGTETEQEKLAYVDLILNVLDMEHCADAMVGVPGQGLNIEQRKRLSIGVELVAKPELLLFLDEPTSGLDSQTAWSICTLLRKLADHGQAILCTIHQPSSQIFHMFDRLLLLSRDGQTLYFGDIGPSASTLIEYFEQNDAPKFQEIMGNPAEWMFDVTNDPGQTTTWSAKYKSSADYEQMLAHQAKLLNPSEEDEAQNVAVDQQPRGEYAVAYARQLRLVITQLFREYWRDPTYMYSKLALCTGLSLFNGLSFTNSPLDEQGLTNILFSIFLLSMLFSTVDQQIIPRLIDNRAMYESREGRSKSYSWFVFLSANVLVEFVWQTVAAVLVFVAWWLPTGIWRNADPAIDWINRGALAFVLVWLFCLWISTFSQAIAAGIQHAESAVQAATLSFWLSLVFCGVLVKPAALPRFWIFIYRVSPLTYFINGMVLAGLEGTQLQCSAAQLFHLDPPGNNGTSPSTCNDYLAPYVQLAGGYVKNPEAFSDCLYCPVLETNRALQDILGMNTRDPWRNAVYMVVYIVFNVLATYFLYWIARVPKKKMGASA